MRKIKLPVITGILVVASYFLLSSLPVQGQDGPVVLPTVTGEVIQATPTLPAPFSATRMPVILPNEEDLHAALSEYRIGYLVDKDETEIPETVTPNLLSKNFNVLPVHDYQTLLKLDEEAPFAAIIIDKSALSFIDYTWVSRAFDRGVVIAVINIYYPELPLITGRDCGKPRDGWFPGNFFIIFSQQLVTDFPEDRTKVLERLKNCEGDDALAGTGALFSLSEAKDDLDQPEGYLIFIGQLLSQLHTWEEFHTWHRILQSHLYISNFRKTIAAAIPVFATPVRSSTALDGNFSGD